MSVLIAFRRRCLCCLPLILLILSGIALCEGTNEVRLKDVNDFETFCSNVNAGTAYEGTTVFLEADMDFTGMSFEPIGNKNTSFFKGTFDGQGYIIENIQMNTTSQYAGLFGYSKGMTVRNAIIGPTSSFTSSYTTGSNIYIGGMIGYCESEERSCIIENSMNMGSVSFIHEITANLYLGGIAGKLYVTNHEVIARNCANYGSIFLTSEMSKVYIGGIVGYSQGLSSTNPVNIQNCLNYGALSNTGSTTGDLLSIGGIIGCGGYNKIENCLSGGVIFSSSSSGSVGNIVGNSILRTNITHTFWTGDAGQESACGSGTPTILNSFLITPNITTVIDLNEYASNTGGNDWNKWLLNENNNEVTFHINATNPNSISITSQIILLPSTTVEDDHTFHWYTDSFRNNLFDSNTVSEDTTLYGGIKAANTYAVTFDFRGGESLSGSGDNTTRTVTYGEPYGELPEVTKTGYTFNGWFTEVDGRGREVTSGTIVTIPNDHTIYASWTTNTYTVTFEFGNGTTTNASFEYNTPIVYPNISERKGHTFTGWVPYTLLMPAHDLTITANWTEVPKHLEVNSTEFVEIVFSTKDLKDEEDAKKIISKYTNDNITITRFERDEDTGYIRVIVKFTDREQAESFVETINNSSEKKKIVRVSFIHEHIDSFSKSLSFFLSHFSFFVFL